jgi:hypothetical protein
MNPVSRNLSILALMAASLNGCSGRCFWQTSVISSYVSMQCLTIEGSRLDIYVYDQVKISRYSWKRDL